jgi:single-stranded-DNA-specific exonuclease
VQDQARESFSTHNERFIVVHDNEIHRGVTGIIAGRLARQFNAPAAVVSVLEGRAVGSVRTARGLVVTDLLARLDDILDDWGGHDAAGGFHLPVSGIETLYSRLEEVLPEMPLDAPDEVSIEIDAEIPDAYLTPKLLETVELFSPFGQENGQLAFLARGVRISEISFMGKEDQHVRLTVDTSTARWPAVFWNGGKRVKVDFTKGDVVDLIFSLEVNFYQGNETPRLAVIDLERRA